MSQGRNSFSIRCDTAALHRMIDELGTDVEEAVRPVAEAGARVLYNAVKQNVASIGKVTGNLQRAIYEVFSKDNSGKGVATYQVSWNAKKAPHGHLLEYGHVQRYAVFIGKDGKWHTAIRPEKRGTPKPRRRASQAEKDAYYLPLKGGPRFVAARPFVRPAAAKMPEAVAAMEAELLRRMQANIATGG